MTSRPLVLAPKAEQLFLYRLYTYKDAIQPLLYSCNSCAAHTVSDMMENAARRCCHMVGIHAESARMGLLTWFSSSNLDSICTASVPSRAVGFRVRLALRERAAVLLAKTR